ncbi:MAG: excinuclease ABC subunit UvrC [Candidatus Izimaplasma sp.]|nr:excinuclease ABC subunit UvrC [Candidatus Izimaplasma bacterium]
MNLNKKIKNIPKQPGSYQFLNVDGKIIYVGKAKNLKNRVSSYFVGSHNAKTTRLVMHIADIEYIITNSELDALLLELNLIKKYNPRYNTQLKDDKTYPYIKITEETHPKVIITRDVKKKSKYLFGPYPNVTAARDTLRIINKLYPLRKCEKLPKQECLYYHMKQCLGPCIKPVSQKQYKKIKQDIKKFLKGDIKGTITKLETLMYEASKNLEFERAQEYKKSIEHIKTTTANQKINLNDLLDRDVVGYHYSEEFVSIEIFFIRNGKISARHQDFFEYYTNAETAIEDYIANFYKKEKIPREIFLPFDFDKSNLEDFLNTKIHQPQRGDKYKLLNLAILNAKDALTRTQSKLKRELDRTINSVEKIGDLLAISPPYRIDAFDNSNLFGNDAVSSMVVYINGKPSKKHYRKYRIKTKDGNRSDYHSMKEVLYRRYQRVLLEDLEKPGLILVDGGKQQINAAKEILNSLDLKIPLAGLVKDDNHNTSFLLKSDFTQVPLKKTSNEFHLLARIQDEAHRFAINYHRNVRSKGIFNTKLDAIQGIGKVSKEKLLKKYKSVNKIKLASLEELKELGITEKAAKNLIKALKND